MAEFFYFNHSVSARCHVGIRALVRKYGIAGYGHYFLFLEEIYASHKPVMDLSQEYILEAIAEEHLMTMEQVSDFVDDCCRLGLFNRELWCEKRHVTSNGICEAFEYKEQKERAGKAGGRPKKAPEKAG